MSRLWGRVIKNHRKVADRTVACQPGEEQQALVELCRQFDIPNPMWLPKHAREFEEFRHAVFLRDHFVEEVNFDRLEVEYLEDEEGRARQSRDPRNAF